MYIYIYIYIYNIYTNLPVNARATVRLPQPWSGDSQGPETFLSPPADKQTPTMTKRAQTIIPRYQP